MEEKIRTAEKKENGKNEMAGRNYKFQFGASNIFLLSPRRLCFTRRLSVCLLATYVKTTDGIFMKILPEMYLWAKKN